MPTPSGAWASRYGAPQPHALSPSEQAIATRLDALGLHGDPALSLSVMDVCGAPDLTSRVVAGYARPTVVVVGGAGKSGSLALAAARQAGAGTTVGVVPHQGEADLLGAAGMALFAINSAATFAGNRRI